MGLTADVCATGVNQVEIIAGSPIHYCYKLTNNSPEPVTALTLLDEDPLLVVPWQPGTAIVAPGESIQTTRAVPSELQPALTETRVTSATWNLLVNGLSCPIGSNRTTVTVVQPCIEVTLRVAGGAADPCAVTTAVNNIGAACKRTIVCRSETLATLRSRQPRRRHPTVRDQQCGCHDANQPD